MRRLICLILISIICTLISCEEKTEKFIECDTVEPSSQIFGFVGDIDFTKSFSYSCKLKTGYLEYMGVEDDDFFIRYTDIQTQYNAETKVLAYYKKESGKELKLETEILGYIQYHKDLECYVQTNSYTKTYTVLPYKNMEEIFDYLFDKKAGYYFFENINDVIKYAEYEVAPNVLKSDLYNKYKLIGNAENNNYLYELNIEDYYMTFNGIKTSIYSDGTYIEECDYLIIVDENDLKPLDLTNYILHPIG